MKLRALLISALTLGACGDDDAIAPDGGVVEEPTAREFTVRIENVAPWTVLKAGSTSTRPDMTEGPLAPGEVFEIRFSAANGHAVFFATMLGESNDWFFAPGPEGIPLITNGVPTSGDVTSYVRLWDAGTEIDQEPAVGDVTGTNQTVRTAGDVDPEPTVREVPVSVRLTDGSTFVRPATSDMIRVTLIPDSDQRYTLRIENVSTPTTLVTSLGAKPVHLSPVAWAVTRNSAVLFTPGSRAPDNGLELLAEAGLADPLGTSLRFSRGVATPISPGVYVVHDQPAPLFTVGAADADLGLERLAEDGDAGPLFASLNAAPPPGVSEVGIFDTPVGASAPGPALPGQAYEVVITGEPGDAVSFATMFGASNDWFFATGPEGIPLFFGDIPRSSDASLDVVLYDAGTEIDQELDVGPDTAPQQAAVDTGRDDRTVEIREVTIERYTVPVVLHLRVTITPR